MKWKLLLALIIAAHIFVLAKMVFFPYPELFVYPYLAKHGFLPYKQIFDQHFPSLLMLPINISTFGLTNPAAARVFSVGLTALTQLFIFICARHYFKSEKKALLANLFYLFIHPVFEGYILWIDSFIPPLTVAAFYFFLRYFEVKHNSDAILAGLFIGASVFIKQSMLPLALVLAIIFYLRSRSLKSTLIYSLGVAIPVAILLFWILAKGLSADFYFWTVRFNFEVYAKMAGKAPTVKQLLRVIIFFAPAALVFLTQARTRLLNIVAGLFLLFSLGAVGNRFELVHLQPALPFVAVLTVSFLEIPRKEFRSLVTLAIFIPAVFLAIYFERGLIGSYVYFFDETTIKTSRQIDTLTQPDQRIFVMGSQPILYRLADRLPAGRVFSVGLPWNMLVTEDKILAGLESDRPSVIVRDAGAEIDGVLILEYMRQINKFVDANYQLAEKVGPNEILVSRKAAK